MHDLSSADDFLDEIEGEGIPESDARRALPKIGPRSLRSKKGLSARVASPSCRRRALRRASKTPRHKATLRQRQRGRRMKNVRPTGIRRSMTAR